MPFYAYYAIVVLYVCEDFYEILDYNIRLEMPKYDSKMENQLSVKRRI